MASNIHVIDLDLLQEEGWIQKVEGDFGSNPSKVDFNRVIDSRRLLLEEAVATFLSQEESFSDYHQYLKESNHFLKDYALFMALKEHFNSAPWYEWPDDCKYRKIDALRNIQEVLKEAINFHQVTQYFFERQWRSLRKYANERGIQLMGDLPFYISVDSVEMRTQPELFKVDDHCHLEVVAGTPPDYFSKEGQLWGNPIYDWDYHHSQNYAWWVQRLQDNFDKFDALRIVLGSACHPSNGHQGLLGQGT